MKKKCLHFSGKGKKVLGDCKRVSVRGQRREQLYKPILRKKNATSETKFVNCKKQILSYY
jgi:hypothetical protein